MLDLTRRGVGVGWQVVNAHNQGLLVLRALVHRVTTSRVPPLSDVERHRVRDLHLEFIVDLHTTIKADDMN